MFRSFQIERFRGFELLKLSGLDRFNLFLGRNNTGKTAILEAFFLILGPNNPGLTFTISGFRGIDQFRIDPEEMWGWLFYGKQMSEAINMSAKVDSGGTRKLAITLGDTREIPFRSRTKASKVLRHSQGTASTTGTPGELIVDYQDESGKQFRSKAFIKDNSVAISHDGKRSKLATSIYVSSKAAYAAENVSRFSQLEETGGEKDLLPVLQVLEPRLQRLSVLISGAGPVIHADIGIGRMIPLPIMGDGIGKLLTVLLSIASSKGGVTLIDELDNGLHYSVMEQVWLAIIALARKLDVQVLATTHSWECLKSAHAAFSSFKDVPYDLRLHRLDREKGAITTTLYDQSKIETALAYGMELR